MHVLVGGMFMRAAGNILTELVKYMYMYMYVLAL